MHSAGPLKTNLVIGIIVCFEFDQSLYNVFFYLRQKYCQFWIWAGPNPLVLINLRKIRNFTGIIIVLIRQLYVISSYTDL